MTDNIEAEILALEAKLEALRSLKDNKKFAVITEWRLIKAQNLTSLSERARVLIKLFKGYVQRSSPVLRTSN